MTIAELPDGRELEFPDSMSDAHMDRFIRALLSAENAAAKAQDEVKAMRAQLDSATARYESNSAGQQATLDAILALTKTTSDGFEKTFKALMADTLITQINDAGDPVRSKKVIK